MKREWQPGDVAMIRVGTAEWEYGLLGDGGEWLCHHITPRRDWEDVQVLPLAVINPESDDVERLAEIFCSAYPNEGWVHMMRAALREFADPKPRIEEPTGLGAVVETAEGRKFVRVADPIDGWMAGKQWQRIGGEINSVRNFGWADLRNVDRVLSEGWSE